MNLAKLAAAPPIVYLLPYTHNGIDLALACLPDGGILRSAFARGELALEQLSAACAKRWPTAALRLAPQDFQPDPERLQIDGTPFQQAVWQHLAELKAGETITYGQLAIKIGRPSACRAVGTAVGANPCAPFIPCHRVIATNGKIGGFAGGTDLKRHLLQIENTGL